MHRTRILWLTIGGCMLLVTACSPRLPSAPTASAAAGPRAISIAAEPARRVAIQQVQSVSGEIRAREQVSVLSKTSGRVQRVLVDVGTSVKAGDLIAELDRDAAQAQFDQARAALAQVAAKLAQVENGARDEDVAAAEAAYNAQTIKLQNMRTGGRPEDIKSAESNVTVARARLAAVNKGADDGSRQALQSAVDSDRAAVASAEAAFAALGGQNAASLQAAQSQVESVQAQISTAQALIASADAALANLTGSSAADLQAVQSANDQAAAQLRSANAALLQSQNPTQASIAQAEAAVEQARAQRQAAEAQQTALEQKAGPPCADAVNLLSGQKISANSTACGEAKAAADAAIQAGEAAIEATQGQLDLLQRGGSPAQQAQLQAGVDQAQAQVTSTRARLDALKNGGIAAARAQADAQKQQAQSQLAQAQASFKVAQANLAAAQNGNLDAQVKQAQSQVTAARERLKVDETRLEVVNRGATDEDLQQAQAMLDQAQQQLAKAQRPFSSFDIQAQEQAVAQAAAQLQKAQHPFTDQDQMAARAAVDQAVAAASLAELGLRETRVVAPASGAVAERLVAPGSLVGPTTPVITLVPPSVELLVNVEESQLGRLVEGQAVQIAVPAFAGETFAGRVSSIAPNVDARTRTAGVRIQPDDSDGRLKAGMSATASVVIARKEAALVVPRAALKTGSPSLLIVDATDRVRKVPVKLGLQGDEGVEILDGLQDGQLVIASNLNDLREGDLVAPRVETVTARAADGQ